MAQVLIVDDEQKIREVIREYAEWNGYEVTEAKDGMEAVDLCKAQDFDVIVMDVMMPRLDGFSAVKEIKKSKDIPVIMLSARAEEYDKLHAFEVGVDDYMVKPFSPKELMARIAAVLARTSPQESAGDRLAFEGLVVDILAREVTIDGEKISLTPKEYELLSFMINNKGIALSREKFINEVWGYDFYGDDRTLDTHIKLLRKKLGDLEALIATVRGVGYRFEAD